MISTFVPTRGVASLSVAQILGQFAVSGLHHTEWPTKHPPVHCLPGEYGGLAQYAGGGDTPTHQESTPTFACGLHIPGESTTVQQILGDLFSERECD
jgi:hypothetical protein